MWTQVLDCDHQFQEIRIFGAFTRIINHSNQVNLFIKKEPFTTFHQVETLATLIALILRLSNWSIFKFLNKNILLIVENGGISNDSNPHHQEAQPHLHILSERKPEDRVSTNHKSAFSLPEDNASTNQKPVYLHQSPEDSCGQLTNLDHHQQHSQLHLYLHHEELERMTTSAAG